MRPYIYYALLALSLSGCASYDDFHYDVVNYLRAECAWISETRNPLAIACPSDYGHGWKDGYNCVADGGSGTPPVLPPKEYWSHHYQNCKHQEAIDAWYQGYQDGATAAEQNGAGQFHYIRPFSGGVKPVSAPVAHGIVTQGAPAVIADPPAAPSAGPPRAEEVWPVETTPEESLPEDAPAPPDVSSSRKRIKLGRLAPAGPRLADSGITAPRVRQKVVLIERLPPVESPIFANPPMTPTGSLIAGQPEVGPAQRVANWQAVQAETTKQK